MFYLGPSYTVYLITLSLKITPHTSIKANAKRSNKVLI